MTKTKMVCCKAAPGVTCNGPVVLVFGRWWCKYAHAPRCGWRVGRGRMGLGQCRLRPVAMGPAWGAHASDKLVPVCRVHHPVARAARAAKSEARYKAYADRLDAPRRRIKALEQQVRKLRAIVRELTDGLGDEWSRANVEKRLAAVAASKKGGA